MCVTEREGERQQQQRYRHHHQPKNNNKKKTMEKREQVAIMMSSPSFSSSLTYHHCPLTVTYCHSLHNNLPIQPYHTISTLTHQNESPNNKKIREKEKNKKEMHAMSGLFIVFAGKTLELSYQKIIIISMVIN